MVVHFKSVDLLLPHYHRKQCLHPPTQPSRDSISRFLVSPTLATGKDFCLFVSEHFREICCDLKCVIIKEEFVSVAQSTARLYN